MQKRLRVNRACTVCHVRKVSCDNARPCSRCVKSGCPERCQDVVPTPRGLAKNAGAGVVAFGLPRPLQTRGRPFESLVESLKPQVQALLDDMPAASKRGAELTLLVTSVCSAIQSAERGSGSWFDIDVAPSLFAEMWTSVVPSCQLQCAASDFGPNKVALTCNRALLKLLGLSPATLELVHRGPVPMLRVHPLFVQGDLKAQAEAIAARAPKSKRDTVMLHAQMNVPLGHITYTPFRVTEVLHYTYNAETPPRVVSFTAHYVNVEVPTVVVPPGPMPTGPDKGKDMEFATRSAAPQHSVVGTLGDLRYTCPYGLPGEPLPDDPFVDVVPPIIVLNMAEIMGSLFESSMYASLADVYTEVNMMEPVTVPFIPSDRPLGICRTVARSGQYVVLDMASEVEDGTASFQVAPGVVGTGLLPSLPAFAAAAAGAAGGDSGGSSSTLQVAPGVVGTGLLPSLPAFPADTVADVGGGSSSHAPIPAVELAGVEEDFDWEELLHLVEPTT